MVFFMKTLIIAGILCSVAITGAASAQSEREIRSDQRSVQQHQTELDDARDRNDKRAMQEANEDLRGARQELREDRRDQETSQYVAPYRHWSQSTPAVGTHLRHKFYGRRYVISNPDHYGLGEIAENQRWIRYGDDVLLMNVREGLVVEVMPRRYRAM